MTDSTPPPNGDTDRTVMPVETVERLLQEGDAREAAATVAALHEADGAATLHQLGTDERHLVAQHLDPGATAKVLEEMDIDEAASLVLGLEDDLPATVLSLTSADVAADVLHALPPDQAESLIQDMPNAEEVTALLQYEDESAGGLMLPDFVVLRAWMTAEEAIAFLRGTRPKSETSNYIFVLDRSNALAGVVSLRDLVLAPAHSLVRDSMNPSVVKVSPGTDQEECARILQRYDLQQLPVVDDQGQVLGVILAEDIIDVMEQEATEDMLRLASVQKTERVLGPVPRGFRNRSPWLLLNLFTVLLAATIISVFEETIAAAAFLAVFLPMIASQGGVAGSQTVTLVTRGLALGELTFRDTWRVLMREIALGIGNGVGTGVIAGALAYAWKGSAALGLVVGTAMVLTLIVAGLFGATVPLVLRALRLDPALGSVVLVTTVTDMAGFGFVLALAVAWL